MKNPVSSARLLLLFLFLTALGMTPKAAHAAFGLTTVTDFYTVDTGAGLVFQVRRTDNGSNTQSPGDIASLKFNGVEYQDQTRGSQVVSGFDYLYTGISAVTVSAPIVNSSFIVIEVQAGYLTHYYIARNGYANIYMGTYFTVEPNIDNLVRYIVRIPNAVLPNGPIPSNILNTTSTVESSDIFALPDGETRSKHYSNMRLIDWSYIGATGNNVGVWMVRDNNEGGSGGPFYRCLNNQGAADQEVTYIVNYGEAQTETTYRTSILNCYTLVFTTGAQPTLPIDTSFFSQLNLIGYVPPSGRGSVTGTGINGRDTTYAYTVGFSNPNAQYWTTASATDGSFTSAGMLPGTYTMTVYKNELGVYTSTATVAAGGTTALNLINITGDPSSVPALWRIGDWDGTPREFLNGDKITTEHPSDVRMSSWVLGPYVVGTSTPAASFPCYQWKNVNNGTQVVQFTLTAAQVAAHTVRIGITTAYAGGRPMISVNSWSSSLPAAPTEPSSRTLTIGSYRGNNTMYPFSVPASAFVVGLNTMNITPISGSSGTTFLSPGYSVDAVDLTNPIMTIGGTVTLQGCASNAQPLTFTFTPTSGGSAIVLPVTPGADGTFLLSTIPAGKYTLGIKGPKWLNKNVAINTSTASVSGIAVTLLGGDVNNDNSVSATDLLTVRQAYGTVRTVPPMLNWNDNADLNCDGQVSGADLAIVRANYGKVGD